MDLFGHLADYEALGRLCDRHELLLLEDSGHVVPVDWDGPILGEAVATFLSRLV